MHCLPSCDGFLGLSEKEATTFYDAKAIIIPFGLEASVTYGGGTQKGPKAILEASKELEFFDEVFWCEPYKTIGINTLAPEKISASVEQALVQLEGRVESVLSHNKFPLTFAPELVVSNFFAP